MLSKALRRGVLGPSITISRARQHTLFGTVKRFARIFVAVVALAITPALAQDAAHATTPDALFLALLTGDANAAAAAMSRIEQSWETSFIPMALETIYLSRNPEIGASLFRLLEANTQQQFGFDLSAWWKWVWNREPDMHSSYATFKSKLYRLLDPKFERYFAAEYPATIRLDEVVWGGVAQDGIPPLRSPAMIPASDAHYLDDANVVFGIEVAGDVRAYPKRILAWHEMFVDEVGAIPVAGVYCTLCGTMILYDTRVNGTTHELGTSGFLYRSNKLMYDQATQSLWNTMWGRPVIGPLAKEDIVLERMSVVTTTWGEWRRRHPETQVLSLSTGHERDYSEGEAYRQYFATDDLMFPVPATDDRMLNKAQVLGLLFSEYPDQPLAISAAFLSEHATYHDRVGDLAFVVLTDDSGANRVYRSEDVEFEDYDGDRTVVDSAGEAWTVGEAALTTSGGRSLPRLPAHRAFWFGWYAAFTRTRLVM